MTGTDESILDFIELMGVTLRGDDVQGFDTRWCEVLLSIKEMHQDIVLGSLHKMRTRDPEQVDTVLAPYDEYIEHKDLPKL